MALQISPKESHGDALRRLVFKWPTWHNIARGGSHPRYRAIIYDMQRLGDLLLAFKAIEKQLAHFGKKNCALAVSPEEMALASKLFPGVAIVTVPLVLSAGGWNLLEAVRLKRKLAAYSCENLICFRHHRSPLASAILRWIPANTRWGIVDHPWMSVAARNFEADLFSKKAPFYFPAQNGIPAVVAANATLVSMVTGEPCRATKLLPLFHHEDPGPQKEIPTLAIAPWGSSNIKRIPEELISKILSGLKAKIDFEGVILAAPDDGNRALELVDYLRAEKTGLKISHIATPDLASMTEQIYSADAVFTCDSFPAHLAVAYDRPTAVLVTGATPGLFGPWHRSKKQGWFTKEMACCGCGWRCIHSRPLCITEIEPQKVIEFLFRQLEGD